MAMRLSERLGVDAETAHQTDYACLLFYVGCTADAEVAADLFDESALVTHLGPAMFGSQREATLAPCARSCRWRARHRRAPWDRPKLPRAVGAYERHLAAACEVAQMLTERLGLRPAMQGLFAGFTERWDGKGVPGVARGEEIPLAVRIVHVARDATFQRMVGGPESPRGSCAAATGTPSTRRRDLLADDAGAIFAGSPRARPGTRARGRAGAGAEPRRRGDRPRAAAMGDFADLASPYLVGHSAAWRSWRARRRALPRPRTGPADGAPRGARARPRAGRDAAADLAQAGVARTGRVGARAAARLPLRARARPLAVRSPRWRRSPPPTTSASTGRAITAAPPPGRSRRRRACSPPPTPTPR